MSFGLFLLSNRKMTVAQLNHLLEVKTKRKKRGYNMTTAEQLNPMHLSLYSEALVYIYFRCAKVLIK